MSIKLQKDLIELGYGDIVGKLDGIVGKKTKDAVKKLQANRKLVIDGIVGRRTLNEIDYLKKKAGLIGTRNFDIDEFKCPDGGSLPSGGMDNQLILNLEFLRWSLGNKPMRINSGYRTVEFNKRIGGIKNSNHLKGKAADIKVFGASASEVYKKALEIFAGVGKYVNFTHVDTQVEKNGFGIRYVGKY